MKFIQTKRAVAIALLAFLPLALPAAFAEEKPSGHPGTPEA